MPGCLRGASPRRGARILALAALAMLGASVAEPQPRHRPWLTGRLLVADASLRDPNFYRTVIYLIRHDADGAFGLIVNRPLGEVSFETALRPFDLEVPPGSGDVRVHSGGPVQPGRGFVLHTPDWTGPDTTVVDGGFALTADPKVLQAMAQGTGPRRARFLLGYAGWAAGQLEAELARGAWGVALADERLVFEGDPTATWLDATARRLLDL
jgi:putative transcriptional regulator